MKKYPLVSILIPTYNQPEFFRQAFESAINQDYPNIEIIVSDDSTDDRVKTVFDEYRNCGRKIQYLKHGGYTNESTGERSLSNMENLLEHAQGEFVNILFHDDLIYPQKISTMMQFFTGKRRDQIAIVSSQREAIDYLGNSLGIIKTIAQPKFDDHGVAFLSGTEVGRVILSFCVNFLGELSTVLIRRKDFYRFCIKKLSPGYFLGVRDLTMWDVSTFLEVCKNNRNVVFLKEPLSAFRMSGGSQNTYNLKIRVHMAMDWLAFIAVAYLHGCYIQSFDQFSYSCENWFKFNVDHILTTDVGSFELNQDIKLDELDALIRSSESVTNNKFDTVLNEAIKWIIKFSARTSEIEKYIDKYANGLWKKRGV